MIESMRGFFGGVALNVAALDFIALLSLALDFIALDVAAHDFIALDVVALLSPPYFLRPRFIALLSCIQKKLRKESKII